MSLRLKALVKSGKRNIIASPTNNKFLLAAVSLNHGVLKPLQIALHANIVQFSVCIPVFYLPLIFGFLKRQADPVKCMPTKKLELKLNNLTRVKILTCFKSSSDKRVINPLTHLPVSHTCSGHALCDLFRAYFMARESPSQQPTMYNLF